MERLGGFADLLDLQQVDSLIDKLGEDRHTLPELAQHRQAYQAARALQLAGTPTVFVGGFRLQDFLDLQAYLQLFTLIDAFWGEE